MVGRANPVLLIPRPQTRGLLALQGNESISIPLDVLLERGSSEAAAGDRSQNIHRGLPRKVDRQQAEVLPELRSAFTLLRQPQPDIKRMQTYAAGATFAVPSQQADVAFQELQGERLQAIAPHRSSAVRTRWLCQSVVHLLEGLA